MSRSALCHRPATSSVSLAADLLTVPSRLSVYVATGDNTFMGKIAATVGAASLGAFGVATQLLAGFSGRPTEFQIIACLVATLLAVLSLTWPAFEESLAARKSSVKKTSSSSLFEFNHYTVCSLLAAL
jgi:hypothetical protein